MRHIFFLVTLLLPLFSFSARAEEASPYVGLGVASGSLNACPEGNCVVFNEKALESTHVRLIVGYDLNRFFGVEGEYSDFGSYKVRNADKQIIGEVKGKAFSLAARGGYKFDLGLSLFAKLGLSGVSTQYSASPAGVAVGELNHHSTGVLFGTGAQYDLNGHLGVRLSYEVTKLHDGAYFFGFKGWNLVGISRF